MQWSGSGRSVGGEIDGERHDTVGHTSRWCANWPTWSALLQKPRGGGQVGFEEGEQLACDLEHAVAARMGVIRLRNVRTQPDQPVRTGLGAVRPDVRSPGNPGGNDGAVAVVVIEIVRPVDLVLDDPFIRKRRFASE